MSILYTIPPNRKNTHLEVKGEIDDAISRLFKNPHEITYTTLLVALLYILRYRHGLENNRTSTSSEQRRLGRPLVLVVAIMLASKFISDQHVSNETWAAENRLNLLQINTAEIIFLKTVDHRLHIDPKSFQRWVSFIFQPHKVSPYMS